MVKIRENINILKLLKDNGLSSYKLRKQKIIGVSRIQRLRHGLLPSWHELDLICRITGKNIGDLIEYIPDPA